MCASTPRPCCLAPESFRLAGVYEREISFDLCSEHTIPVSWLAPDELRREPDGD